MKISLLPGVTMVGAGVLVVIVSIDVWLYLRGGAETASEGSKVCESPPCAERQGVSECLFQAVCFYEYARIKRIAYCPPSLRLPDSSDVARAYDADEGLKKMVTTGQFVGETTAIADTPGIEVSSAGAVSLNPASQADKNALCSRYVDAFNGQKIAARLILALKNAELGFMRHTVPPFKP